MSDQSFHKPGIDIEKGDAVFVVRLKEIVNRELLPIGQTMDLKLYCK